MERIAIDVLGPLPETDTGNKYFMICIDYFTKWLQVYPRPNEETETIAKILVEQFVCRFGVPFEIHSDQGRNFCSKIMTSSIRYK